MLDQVFLLVFIFIFYVASLTIYRFFFHPLSSYPGPKLSAVTFWVEFYHDVFRRGQFIFKIQEWHAKYGPIIRINPHELHVDDFNFYETLYGGPGSKRDKYKPWCRMAGSLGSAFATPGHELHRSRRKAAQNFFSKAAITKMEPLILQMVTKLEHKFEQAMRSQEVLHVNLAYFALTLDVINQYAFADEHLLLDDDGLTRRWYETLHMGFESGPMSRQFPWVFPIITSIPVWITGKLSKPLKLMLDWREQGKQRVESIMNHERESTKKQGQKTIFHEIRDSDLPASEKGVGRLVDEAQVFMGAGSETTARMLSVTTYHLLTNKDCLRRLQHELSTATLGQRDLKWAKLEQLPYLTAVVSEGLRLSYGITTRLPRVAVGEILTYNEKMIPEGTPVGMTQYFTLMSPAIFPEPQTFQPERWLNEDGTYNRSMNKLILSFGKGSRHCMGMSLAYAEMYITLARILGRFELELYETERDDIELAHDFFTAIPKDGSKGVRVHVKKLLTKN